MGHSMGGYGTWRLAMKYPEVYWSIYAMSSCCLMNNPQPPGAGRGGAAAGGRQTEQPRKQAPPPRPNRRRRARRAQPKADGVEVSATSIRRGGRVELEPKKPPLFFDLPTEEGKFRPEIAAKWVANSPLAMVDQIWAASRGSRPSPWTWACRTDSRGPTRQMDATLTQFDIHIHLRPMKATTPTT